MSVTQNNFSQYAAIGYHGQLNTDFPWWAGSFHAEGGPIGFGVAVSLGTADKQAVLGGASAEALIGVTLRTQAVENDIDGLSAYAESRAMSVLKKGRVFLKVSDGSESGAQVYVVPATGELVSTSTENVALAGASFVRSAAPGEISEIELK